MTYADLKDLEEKLDSTPQIEQLRCEIYRKLRGMPSSGDIDVVYKLLDSKANQEDIENELQEKANKLAVANAFAKKANKEDLDALGSSKADFRDLQQLYAALESKVEHSALDESISECTQQFTELSDLVKAQDS